VLVDCNGLDRPWKPKGEDVDDDDDDDDDDVVDLVTGYRSSVR
jgi:hypothetical protein